MKNLKKLLAVIVSICVLATFTVPAFAADTATYANADQAQKLHDMGLYAGTSATVFTPDLGSKLTREQGMVLLFALFGKTDAANALTDEEVNAALAGFADASKISSWAKKAMAYALKNGITAGTSATTVGPQGTLTGNQFATFILKQAGFEVADWTKAAADLEAKGVTGATAVATTQLTRNDFAGIGFGTLTVKNAAGKTVIEALVDAGKVTAEAAIAAGVYSKVTATVAATGAKKLTVTFNQAVDTTKAVIEAKRGSVKPSVKSITFAEDKKSAVIEFTTVMAEGDYTVTVTGLGDALTATVKVAAEKLTAIKFLSDVAVLSSNGLSITTSVKAENQYGEDVSAKLASANINYSKGSSASISNGVLTINNATAYNVDDKVVVTIVDSATGVVATKTLTVAKAAAVASIEFGTLATDDKDQKDKDINVDALGDADAAKYYMPITVKDQYGNVLNASQINSAVSIYSSNTHIVKLASPAAINLSDDRGTAITFVAADATAASGTAVITAVSVSTGISANTTITVKDNAKLDVVTLSAPASELKLTVATELPITVADTYGKDVALKDITTVVTSSGLELKMNNDTSVRAVGATFSIVNDYVKNVKIIKITPTAKNIIITVTTATGKYQSLSLTANDAPVVTSIKGVKSDFVSMLANDSTLTTDLAGNLVFLDQYGEEIAAPVRDDANTSGAIHYTVAKETAGTVTSEAGGTITSTTTTGSVNYVVTLKKADNTVLDTYTVGVTVVDKDKITAFGIKDLNKFYTVSGAGIGYQQDVDVYGLVDGKKVVVNQNMVKSVTADNGLLGINATTGLYTPTDVDTDSKDVAAKITVLVANTDNTYVVTKDVVYSNAAPKATSLEAQYDGKKVEGGTIQMTVAELNKSIVPTGAGDSKLQFVAKDQYGVQRAASNFTVVVTNNGTGGTISSTGVGSGFTAGDSGKYLNVNVFVDGFYQTLKIVVE